jgi:hypothetical protein
MFGALRRHPLHVAAGIALALAVIGLMLAEPVLDPQITLDGRPGLATAAELEARAARASALALRSTLAAVSCAASALLVMLVGASLLVRTRLAPKPTTTLRQQVRTTHVPSQRPEQRKLIRRQRPLDPRDGGWQ